MTKRIYTTRPAADRFWSKAQGSDYTECWTWTAGTFGDKGYGAFWLSGSITVGAHCWAYEFMFGPIPDGLHLDHLCRNPPCVNPWHLDPVTVLVNVQRSPIHFGSRTHCPQGHPYDEENTKYRTTGGRKCRACAREYMAAKRRRQRAEAA